MIKRIAAALIAGIIISVTLASGYVMGNEKGAVFNNDELSGELTVSCYDSTGTKSMLEEAARFFESEYPNVKITVESFSTMPETRTVVGEDGATYTFSMSTNDPLAKMDYISRTDVEIMSGRGADVYAIDALPFYKYVVAGSFEELSGYIEGDNSLDLSGYQTSVFDAVAINGVQGIVPIDYRFHFVTYDSTLFNDEEKAALDKMKGASYEELIKFGTDAFTRINESSEAPIYMFERSADAGMMFSLLDENYGSFLDVLNKKANFTDGLFAGMLESIRNYGKLGYLEPPYDPSTYNEQNRSDRVMFKVISDIDLLRYFISDQYGLSMIGVSSSKIYEDDKIIGVHRSPGGDASFDLGNAAAINANSKNKRLAWEYIKFLLSYDMQTSGWTYNIPVLKKAHEDKTRMLLTGRLWGMDDARESLTQQGEEELAEYLKAVDELTSQINTYYIKDTTVEDIIKTEIYEFFGNSKSAEEAANVIQNKLFLYLNE